MRPEDTAAKLARRYWREVGERDRTGLSHHSGDVIAPKIESDEPLTLELADFVDAICSGERMEYQTAIASSVVRLVEAAEQSLREGGQEIAVEQNLRENRLVAASGWAVL